MRPNYLVAFGLAVLVTSCGGGSSSPTTPTPTAATPAPTPTPTPTTLSLAGTWTGTLTDPSRPAGNGVIIRSWVATQSGAAVTGLVTMDIGEGTLANATFGGTVSGNQLTAITFIVAGGSLPGLAACSFTGTGTNAATASSISGLIAMTFASACVGNDRPSATPTGNWQITLAK